LFYQLTIYFHGLILKLETLKPIFLEVIYIANKEPLAPAFIAEKHQDHVLFTGTAMIPGEPDCDYENGEKIFTEQEISDFRQSYKNYGILDEEHTFLRNNRKVGEPVEDFLLPGATKMTNVYGEEREYPRGTWVVKSKITDPELMVKAEKGEIAYSPTVIPEERAIQLMAAKGRTLIKDVPNPVVYTLSLTTHPCIDNSCQVGKSAAVKYGVSISKTNKSILEKARDIINSLISPKEPDNGGDNVTKSEEEKNKEYVTKSDLEEFGNGLVQKFKEASKADPPKKNPEQNTSSDAGSDTQEGKCPKCGAPVKAADKFCSNCGTALKAKKSKDKEEKDRSKAIKNHDDGKDDTAFKSIEHYAGRDLKGRPIKARK
jgi:hypothetical protein